MKFAAPVHVAGRTEMVEISREANQERTVGDSLAVIDHDASDHAMILRREQSTTLRLDFDSPWTVEPENGRLE